MTDFKQIGICGNCNHPINSFGTNRCPICHHPLAGSKDPNDRGARENVERIADKIRGERREPSKHEEGE